MSGGGYPGGGMAMQHLQQRMMMGGPGGAFAAGRKEVDDGTPLAVVI